MDKYEEGDVYTRLLDTDLTLLIRLKDKVSRTKRDETPDRNFSKIYSSEVSVVSLSSFLLRDFIKTRQYSNILVIKMSE